MKNNIKSTIVIFLSILQISIAQQIEIDSNSIETDVPLLINTNSMSDINFKTSSDLGDVNILVGATSAGSGIALESDANQRYWNLWVDSQVPDTDLFFYLDGNLTAAIDDDGSYQQLSDRRFKKEIKDMESVLDKVLSSRPKSYKMKNDENEKQKVGFIAQELIELFPEVVEKEGEYYMVDYSSLTAVLFKGMQEQQIIIDSLIERIEKLEEGKD